MEGHLWVEQTYGWLALEFHRRTPPFEVRETLAAGPRADIARSFANWQ